MVLKFEVAPKNAVRVEVINNIGGLLVREYGEPEVGWVDGSEVVVKVGLQVHHLHEHLPAYILVGCKDQLIHAVAIAVDYLASLGAVESHRGCCPI